jgi:uncharacterized metal-binding protein YceD (DUF177 family)
MSKKRAAKKRPVALDETQKSLEALLGDLLQFQSDLASISGLGVAIDRIQETLRVLQDNRSGTATLMCRRNLKEVEKHLDFIVKHLLEMNLQVVKFRDNVRRDVNLLS